MNLMGIAKKTFMGASDEENQRNKARMREIFNASVPNGDDYRILYCHMSDYTNAVVVSVTRHSNFIVGYKEGEVVVIPVDPDLGNYGEAVVFNKENGGQTKTSMGYCYVANEEAGFQLEPISYVPGLNKASKYSVSVIQSSAEVSDFRKFFKKGF